jgi:hypothetical protein
MEKIVRNAEKILDLTYNGLTANEKSLLALLSFLRHTGVAGNSPAEVPSS